MALFDSRVLSPSSGVPSREEKGQTVLGAVGRGLFVRVTSSCPQEPEQGTGRASGAAAACILTQVTGIHLLVPQRQWLRVM